MNNKIQIFELTFWNKVTNIKIDENENKEKVLANEQVNNVVINENEDSE